MALTAEDLKATMKSQWGSAAGGWDGWFEWYTRNFAPVIDWCCDAARLTPGASVLDIACGSGQPALAAARRVQPGGRITAVDIAPEMLEVAAQRAVRLGLPNVSFQEMDAEHLRFPDATFDAVTFAYALMFCPNPVRAVAEIGRVLKPGGRAAIVVWDDPSKSPMLTVAGGSVAKFLAGQPPNPNAPGAFRFALPGSLDAVLRAGGFTDVSIESRSMTTVSDSVDEYWRMFLDNAAGMKARVGTLSSEDRERLRKTVEAAAQPFVVNGRLELAATSLCASARR